MGVADSKLLAQSVLSACHNAETEGKSSLDGNLLWGNDAIQQILKNLCQHIPPNIRGSKTPSALKKSIARPRKRIDIPQVVQDLQRKRKALFLGSNIQSVDSTAHFERNECYSSLFPSSQTSVLASTQSANSTAVSLNNELYPSINLVTQNDVLADCYRMVVSCEEQLILNKIRLRLLYVAFYRAKQDIQPGSQYEYSDAAKLIAQAISHATSSNESFDSIHKQIRTWIGYGERYSLLADDLGGLGVLYILPDSDPETLWRKELPKDPTRQGRRSVLQKLRESGICEEANGRSLHDIAEFEVNGISNSLKDAVLRNTDESVSQMTSNAASEPLHKGTQSAGLMSSYTPNNTRQTAMNNSLTNRADGRTWTQSTQDALAQDAICAPTHHEPISIHSPDANIAASSSASESHQSSDSLDTAQARIDNASSPFHSNGALPPGNHPGPDQQQYQQRTNVSPQNGFFNVLQAFQGATLPTGYTDATQATSTGFLGAPGQFWDPMQGLDRHVNAQVDQRTTWVEDIQPSSGTMGIGGYHNVYQAVQPSSLPGFMDANFAMQGGWAA